MPLLILQELFETTMQNYPYQNTELENLQGEFWKDIPGLEMYFKVSNYGRIKRLEYKMEYSNGGIHLKPEKIIRPVVTKFPNHFMKDTTIFLRVTITLHKHKHNYTLTRLVYHCFVKSFKIDDNSIVILTKDRDGLNIKPSNLKMASHSEKQKRIFDLKRHEPLVINEAAKQKGIENSRLINSKQVTQYNMQGKKIETYMSASIAAAKTGIKHTNISSCARGREFSAGGYIWCFGSSNEIDITPMHELIAQRKKNKKELFGQKVSQYNMDGKRIAIYLTISDAAKETDIKDAEIRKVLYKKRYSAGGFYWQKGYGPNEIDLSGYEYTEAMKIKIKERPVQQFSKDDEPLQKFYSIKTAAEFVGVAGSTLVGALKGWQKTSGGYKWKYL
jgi:hypothetical protein